MEIGFLKAKCYVKGANGSEVSQTLVYYDCPGYRDTARMLVESALCFVFDKEKIKVDGGFYTSASC